MKDTDRARLLVSIQGMAGSIEANLGSLLSELRSPATLRAQTFDAGPHSGGISDPTGEAIAASPTAGVLTDLDSAMTKAFTALLEADQIRERFLPALPFKPRQLTTDDPGPLWCKSCWRNNKTCEPVSEHYKGLCRWCGDFLGTHGRRPPLVILERRHRGQKISVQEIQEAIAGEKKHTRKKAS